MCILRPTGYLEMNASGFTHMVYEHYYDKTVAITSLQIYKNSISIAK